MKDGKQVDEPSALMPHLDLRNYRHPEYGGWYGERAVKETDGRKG
jgi:hypothetical protein